MEKPVKQKEKIVTDFTTGSVTQKLLLFSWPLVLSNLLQIVYNLVDMVIVGQFVGSAGLSAVANGGDVVNLPTLFCTGFAAAGQVLIAQSLGRGDREGVRKNIGTMFSFLTLMSLIIMVLGLWQVDWVLRTINIPPEAYDMARQYTQVCMSGMFFIFGYNYVSSTLRGMGDSIHPFMFIAIAAVTNLILDLVFVAGLGWGAWGAALATVISQAASFLSCLVFLYRNREDFGFDFKPASFRIERGALWRLVRLGVPIALQHSAVSISKIFVSSYINSFGLVFSAINGIGAKISKCAYVISNALGSASTTMVGQCFGAGKQERIRTTVYSCMAIGLVYAALLSVVFALFPERIFSLFNQDPAVLAMCRSYVPIAVLNFFAFAVRSPMLALINGLGCSELSLAQVIFGSILCRVGLSYLLGSVLGHSTMGFWLGESVAGYVPFIIGGVFFWSGLWRKRKPIVPAVELQK